MTNYTWNGAAGDYLDPAQWTPNDVPLYGSDTTATINRGTVTLSGAEPNGVTLTLINPTLVLSNAALGPDMTLDATSSPTLEVDGYDANYGTIAVGNPITQYATLYVRSKGFGQLNQDGTVTVGPSATLDLAPNTLLDNEGLIALNGGTLNASGRISGNGTIQLTAPGSKMNVIAGVDAGQTVLMQQGTLAVLRAGSFAGTLAGFSSSTATVTFGDLQFDAATYVQDGPGAHLELTSNGTAVDEIPLADTPATQYTVLKFGATGATSITPTQVFSDGSIPGSIAGAVTIQNATADGQAVALGGSATFGPADVANLILDNATLGPDLVLTVTSTAATGRQVGTLTVQGNSTTDGQINLVTSAEAQPTGNGNSLSINIQPGAQLNQEGTLSVISPQTVGSYGSSLDIFGAGTLNNDGLIYIGPGSSALFQHYTTGSGTITVDHANASLYYGADSTQTLDLLAGSVTISTSLQAMIKDWNSNGSLVFFSPISSVQFNQTSDAGGDLQLFDGTKQVGDLNVLGAYATSDFTLTHMRSNNEVTITASGHAPPSA